MKAHVEIPKVSSLRDLIRVVFFNYLGFYVGCYVLVERGIIADHHLNLRENFPAILTTKDGKQLYNGHLKICWFQLDELSLFRQMHRILRTKNQEHVQVIWGTVMVRNGSQKSVVTPLIEWYLITALK